MRASSRPTGEMEEDEPGRAHPEGGVDQRRDRRLVVRDGRARVISQIKLQRSRVSVGDYVSDEVTKFRGERTCRIERQIVAMPEGPGWRGRRWADRGGQSSEEVNRRRHRVLARLGESRAIEAEQTRLLPDTTRSLSRPRRRVPKRRQGVVCTNAQSRAGLPAPSWTAFFPINAATASFAP